MRLISAVVPAILLCLLVNGFSHADTTSISVWRNLPLIPVALPVQPSVHYADFLPPLGEKLLQAAHHPKPLLVVFPRGGVATSSSGTGDPAIPNIGSWGEWTGASAGALIAQLPASGNNLTGCQGYEAANVAACGQNVAGSIQLTGASISGTTLTIPAAACSALVTGATIINNNDVLAAASGAATPLTGGTYIAAGGPLTITSCASGATLTLNQTSNSGTVSAENMVINPTALQASNLTTTVGNFSLPGIFGFSTIGFDPASGCGLLWNTGGHAAAQAVGMLRLCLSDVEAGSGSANWKLVQNPNGLYPASFGLSATPSSGIPGWSYQTYAISNGDYIVAPNLALPGNSAGGVYGPTACHEYHFSTTVLNGWGGIILNGGASCGAVGSDSAGAGFFTDMANGFVLGPIFVAPTSPEGGVNFKGLHQGYLPEFGSTIGQGQATAAPGPDGNYYAVATDDVPGPILGVLRCPLGNYQNSCSPQMSTDAAPTWHVLAGGSICFPGFDPALAVNDPGNIGRILYLVYGTATNCQEGGSGTTGATHLEFFSNITPTGSSGTYNNITISGTLPSWFNACDGIDDCNISIAHYTDADTATSVSFLAADGGPHLAKITITWTGSAYTAAATDLSSSSGTPPPLPSATSCNGGGGSSESTLAYMNLKGYQLAVMSYCGRIFPYTIAHVCPPVGSQAPDGTLIGAPTACTEQDVGGNVWAFGASVTPGRMEQKQANYVVNENGSNSGLVAYQLQIAQSGQQFLHQACGPISVWLDSSGRQVPSPTGAGFINHAIQTSPSVNYRTLRLAETTGISSGATVTIDTQNGVPIWYDSASIGLDNFPRSGIRIVGQSGAALYCGSSGNGGVLEQYFNTSSGMGSANLIVTDLELAYNHETTFNGPDSCFNNVNGAANPTLIRVKLHDCDMGLESDNGIKTGVFTAVEDEHNGGDTGTEAPSHGIYLSGNDPTNSAVFNGGWSVCPYTTIQSTNPMDDNTIGFNFKSRYAKLSIYNYIVGQPSKMQAPNTACVQQTQHDYSCGGQIVMGAADPVITPASLTSSGTTATITLPTATASAGTYNSTTGIVTLTIPSTNFLPGTPFVVSAATGTGSFAAINGEWASQTGSGTTLTFAIETGLSMTITGATVQYEFPNKIGDTLRSTVSGASVAAYNGTYIMTVATLTSATYTFAGGTSPATGATFTIPGGGITEYGPDTISGANGMIRFGAETSGGPPNCPAGGTGFATNTLTITNWTFINDSGANDWTKWIDIPAVYQYGHGWTVTFVNCTFINPRATSLSDAMGVGTTDGGGNHLYHSRADWANTTAIVPQGSFAYPAYPPISMLEPANDNEMSQVA